MIFSNSLSSVAEQISVNVGAVVGRRPLSAFMWYYYLPSVVIIVDELHAFDDARLSL